MPGGLCLWDSLGESQAMRSQKGLLGRLLRPAWHRPEEVPLGWDHAVVLG